MPKQPFHLDWMGGVPERAFRQLRPGIEKLPWGTLDLNRYPTLLVERARVSWTEAAYNEYCTAAAFTELIKALLEANAPIDLIGMVSDFITDEMLHVELTSRLAMELGGGAPYYIDFETLTLPTTEGLTAIQRANEHVIRTCCVAETFSVPMLATCYKSAAHPLTRQVLEYIVRDEASHGVFGFHYLEWAVSFMDEAERVRLGHVALQMLNFYKPFWSKITNRTGETNTGETNTSERFLLQHINELGWAEAHVYAEVARETIRKKIIMPLTDFGILLDPISVQNLLT